MVTWRRQEGVIKVFITPSWRLQVKKSYSSNQAKCLKGLRSQRNRYLHYMLRDFSMRLYLLPNTYCILA